MTHDEILQLLYDETLVGNAPAVKEGVEAGLESDYIGYGSRIENCHGHAGSGIEKIEEGHFRRQALLKVLQIVADNLHAGEIEGRYIAPQYVEMTVKRWIRDEMHPRFNNGTAGALGLQTSFNSIEYLTIAHIQSGNIGPTEISDGHSGHSQAGGGGESAP
jgi:hypothetical protein